MRHEEEREEREKAMGDIRDTQSRLGRATGQDDGEGIGAYGRGKTAAELNARKEQRKRYQFEATGSDDELEDELDGNLDEISDMTKRLKALGTAMGQELDQQNDRLVRINEKTTRLTYKVDSNTDRVYISIHCVDRMLMKPFTHSSRGFTEYGYFYSMLPAAEALDLFLFALDCLVTP